MILGLQLAEGIDLADLGRRYAVDPYERFAAAWSRGEEAGLSVLEGDRVRLTDTGRLRSNELFGEILAGLPSASPSRRPPHRMRFRIGFSANGCIPHSPHRNLPDNSRNILQSRRRSQPGVT